MLQHRSNCCYNYVPKRWVVCTLCGLAIAIASYKSRCMLEIYNLVTSIEVITDERFEEQDDVGCPYVYEGCWISRKKTVLPFPLPQIFWDPKVVRIGYMVYALGKLLFLVPAGMIADAGGAWILFAMAMFLMSALHFLLPMIASAGRTLFMVRSFLDGMVEATMYPCSMCLAGRWAHESERNLFVACIVIGWYIGDITGHFMFRILSLYPHWEVTPYSAGVLGIIWFILWCRYGYTPRIHYTRSGFINRLFFKPWRKIFSSAPFLSVMIAFCAQQWLVTATLTWCMYEYQVGILHLPQGLSSISSLACIGSVPAVVLASFFSDWLISNGVVSRTACKKIFVVAGTIVPAGLFPVFLPLVGCNSAVFAGLFVAEVHAYGLADTNLFTSPLDLSKAHAGSLMSIMIFVQIIISMFSNTLAGWFISREPTYTEWYYLFWFVFGTTVVLITPFLIWGSGEDQQWDAAAVVSTPRLISAAEPEGDNIHEVPEVEVAQRTLENTSDKKKSA